MHFVSRILDAFGGGGQSVYIERHRCTRSLSLQQTVTDSNSYAAKQNGKRRPRLGKNPDRISVDHLTRTLSCALRPSPGLAPPRLAPRGEASKCTRGLLVLFPHHSRMVEPSNLISWFPPTYASNVGLNLEHLPCH